MNRKILKIAKSLAPPIAVDLYRRLTTDARLSFSGNYRSWTEARDNCGGYDSELILDRVKDALLKVKNGEAVYERDSVLFDKVEYAWPLLAALLWISSRSGNRLNIVDFGGSLGTTYYQNRKFLDHLTVVNWSIVEQEKFAECGRSHFQNEQLSFYDDLDACIRERHPDAILFSSVVQYLERPYDLLTRVLAEGFTYIVFDRTPFLEHGDDRLTVQVVPPEIYPASYPAWFFDREKFLEFFSKDYQLMAEFDSFESFQLDDIKVQNKGFIFLKKS